MNKGDWYRNVTWTPEVREQFFARLKRSRTDHNKAQYLLIQAYHLQHEASPPLYEAALELLELLIQNYPHPAALASAYLQKARCLEALGRIQEAVQAYRSALAAEKKYPVVKTTAALDFAMFVIRHELREYYDRVLDHLGDRETIQAFALFPIGQYQIGAAFAIILAEKGEKELARKFALKALAAARAPHSGFRYHPNVGLVRETDPRIHSALEKLTEGSRGFRQGTEEPGPFDVKT